MRTLTQDESVVVQRLTTLRLDTAELQGFLQRESTRIVASRELDLALEIVAGMLEQIQSAMIAGREELDYT